MQTLTHPSLQICRGLKPLPATSAPHIQMEGCILNDLSIEEAVKNGNCLVNTFFDGDCHIGHAWFLKGTKWEMAFERVQPVA